MAYFYFDFKDVDKQKLHNLLPSLLIQLSARSDPCCDILSQLYSSHERGVRKPNDRTMVECGNAHPRGASPYLHYYRCHR
jgi:hypothetical protein